MYRGGNPQEAEYERLYGAWLADKTNKTKFTTVLEYLNALIAHMKRNPPNNSGNLEKLESTKKYLDELVAKWPSEVKVFSQRDPSTISAYRNLFLKKGIKP
jgi:hypothetical protein